MDKFLSELKSALKTTALTPEEKDDIRRKLVFVAERDTATSHAPRFRFRPVPLALLVALLSGSTSFAAENSLPGDLLYPLKIGINENIRSVLAVSDTAEATWSAELVARRLDEAEKLLSEARLDDTTKSEIEEKIREHTEKAEAQIEKLESSGVFDVASTVSSALEASLTAHEKILAKFAENDRERGDDTKEQTIGFASTTNTRTEKATKLRVAIEDKILAHRNNKSGVATMQGKTISNISEPAVNEKIGSAEKKIAEVREFASKNTNRLASTTVVAATNQLTEADQLIADAKTKLEAGEYDGAFVLAGTAERIAQTAKLLLEAQKNLKIEVKLNGEAERQAHNIRERLGRHDESRNDSMEKTENKSENHDDSGNGSENNDTTKESD